MRIGIPFILQFVASIAGQFCPGERVSSFSCTTELTHTWSGTALDGQCPSNNPLIDDVITLSSALSEGDTVPCGIFTANVTNITTPMMGGNALLSSTISFIANSSLDGTEVVCRATQTEVERYPITIIDPPTAPDISMLVNFTEPRVAFVIKWDGTAVVSDSAVTGFQVNSPSGITCDDTSSSPSAMESQCTWEPSAVGQTHSICVSAINCDSQQGASDCVSVNLQVPVAPTLTACPVYDQSGPLLRIESNCTTVSAVDIADGVDGSPDAYIFSYNDGDDSVIPSGQCTGGICTDEFTPDPAVSQYTVSVTARNVVGEGPPDTAGPFNTPNDRLGLTVDVDQKKFVCDLQSGFMGSGTTQCEIIYGTDASYSNLSFMDTGSNTSTTITVALTATLQAGTTYYYIATATSGNVCARLQGSFTTACVPDGLVEEGSSVVLVDGDCDPSDPDDVGGVLISAGTGRACYTGTTAGSTAKYFCNCEDSYRMMPETAVTRVCLLDGNWSEPTVPQCQPRCDRFPNPVNDNSRFVGPIVCQPDNPLMSATYSCGRGKDDITIQFLTPANGECSWEDPPCKVRYASILGIMGASFYGSIVGNIFYLIISFLCYRPKQTWLIPFIIIVSIPLPVLGLAWAWWLVRERVPVVSSIDKDKSFVRKWWRAIVIAIGVFLYLLYFAIFIALAVIFAPQNVLPSDGDFGLLFAGFAIATITFVFWIVAVNLLCCLPRPVPEGADHPDFCKKGKRKKTRDVEMVSTLVQQGSIELKENISHGPVPSQPPAPQQHAPPMYDYVQPGTMEMIASDSTPVQHGSIEMKENISYGPVPSRSPAPQQHAPMHEELTTHVNIAMKTNVAYGPIGH